ncbi:hypothetical protein D3C72_1109930 [compost metagenome]
MQAGTQGVAIGFGPEGGEPDHIGLQARQQRGQVGILVRAVDGEACLRLRAHAAVRVAQQVQLHRRIGARGCQRHGFHHIAALGEADAAQDEDAQMAVCGQRLALWHGQRGRVGNVVVGDIAHGRIGKVLQHAFCGVAGGRQNIACLVEE